MNSSWKVSIRRFFVVQIVLFFVIFSVVTVAGIFSRRSQGEYLGAAVRNDFVIGDMRGVISALNYSLPLGFTYVNGVGINDQELFGVGLKDEVGRDLIMNYTYEIKTDLSSSSSAIGKLNFYFPMLSFFWVSVSIWLLFVLLGLPLILLENKKIKNEYKKTLLLKEAEIRHSLAEQVAHDIRSPLSVLNLIASSITTSDEVKDVYSGAVRRINEIANQLLNSNSPSQVNTGIATETNSAPLNSIVSEIFEEKKVLWSQSSNVSLSLDIGSGDQTIIQAEASGLKRMLSNLLNNAFEALNEQSGEISIGTRESKSSIVIYVLDSGKGMDDEMLRSIGSKGFTSGKADGHGLGIYGAKKYIEEHNGTIAIKSKVGQGTLIEISLPKA